MPDSPLEISLDEFEHLIEQATQSLQKYLGQLEEIAPWNPPSDSQKVIAEFAACPTNPVPFDELLGSIFGKYLTGAFQPASPGYLAYIPGGGLLHAAVADLIASAINQYVGVSLASPWLSQLEYGVIRWFCDWFGLPKSSSGYLSSGGSTAGWSAITVAREFGMTNHFSNTPSLSERASWMSLATAYISQQSHHSVLKGLKLAGFSEEQVRIIGVDEKYRIDVQELKTAIEADRAVQRIPWLIVGQAGTTNTGSVDPLPQLAQIAQQESAWFHVDAAYGGAFVLTERGQQRLAGIAQADSIVFDPHKGLFLPFGTGCLLVRNRNHLSSTFGMTSDYMPAMQDSEDRADFCELSPELSRDMRGLRIWVPMMMHGVEAFREQLDEKLNLAEEATCLLKEMSSQMGCPIEIVEPQLSVVGLRWTPSGLSKIECDLFNEQILDRINRCGRVFVTSTKLNGAYFIRLAFLSFRTHRDRMQMAIEDMKRSLIAVQQGLAISPTEKDSVGRK